MCRLTFFSFKQILFASINTIYVFRQTIILGLLWQILKLQLLSDVSLESHPEVYLLKKEGESEENFYKLSKEEILLRWINHHLIKTDVAAGGTEIKNFDRDMKVSQVAVVLYC
jgi:hypothetical protein